MTRVIPGSDIPLVMPEVSDYFLPNANEYVEFRKKYPRLAGGQTRNTAQAVAPTIPFIASAHEHAETFPVISRQYAAGSGQETIEFNIPSYGYLRAIWLDVNMPKQKGAAAEELAIADGPFVAVTNITLLDTNGAPIYGPLNGYNAFLSNLYGGYTYKQDLRELPTYKTIGTGGEFRYQIRIPIEISHHDGTGCIGNQNAAAPYRLRITLASSAEIYKKEPEAWEAKPLTVTPILEAWSLPNAADALGRPQAQLPPNYGTVQYWSERTVSGIVVGNNNVQVLRVGNLIRNLIFVGRKVTTNVRTAGVLPEFPIINWDARQLVNETAQYRKNLSYESLETQPGTTALVPTIEGVYAYTFGKTNQSRAGDDKPWLWLPTVEATRLELTGTSTVEGTIQILVNDIAPAEVNPTQRYAVPSATGFHPSAEVPNPNQP